MAFIATWAQNKAAEYLKTGLQAGGTLAGDAVGGVGGLIESSGHSFGESTVNGSVRGVGAYINGYGDNIKRLTAADGPVRTAKKVSSTPALPESVLPQKTLPPKAQTTLPAESRKVGPAPKSATKLQDTIASRPAAIPKPGRHRAAAKKGSVARESSVEATTAIASPTKIATASKKPVARVPISTNSASGGKKRKPAASQPKHLHKA